MTAKKHEPEDDLVARREHDEELVARRAEEDAAVGRHQRLQDVNLDVSLAGLGTLIGVVKGLLALGVTVGEFAEKATELLAPSDVPALEAFVSVLQEAAAALKKV